MGRGSTLLPGCVQRPALLGAKAMAVILVLSRDWLDNCKGTSCSGSLTAQLLETPGAVLEPHKILK